MIAGFIFLRLRGILGKRTGFEGKAPSQFEKVLNNIQTEKKVFQNENPFTEPTTRGGVYFSDTKDTKIQATVFNTDISKYLSNAMLGPNKTFLDILIESEINNESKISLVTNLTNTMQNSSKIVLYLILKDIIIKSD